MTDALKHRGPDFGTVVSIGRHAVLGHRRLSIMDLSPAANQPMSDESDRYTIVYNGEVYNFGDLKTQLQKSGHRFRTTGDTEIVLKSFIQWGTSCFAKFNGMFGLAIWDNTEKQLICARDRFGKKPFYYTELNREFSFASELSALLVDDSIAKKSTISIEALNHFFSLGYILSPCTLYKEIYKLEPATFLRVSSNGIIEKSEYWDYKKCFQTPTTHPEPEIAETVRALLTGAVNRRLVADVGVGALLSGGLDSSAVCALCNPKRSLLSTFSVGFSQSSYDESVDAKTVAEFLGTFHNTLNVDLRNDYDFINKAVSCFDEPFADTSLVPMVAIARFASSKVKVVLSGDGADEIFGGYITYQADRAANTLRAPFPGFLRTAVAQTFSSLAFDSGKKMNFGFKLKQFSRGMTMDYQKAHFTWRELFDEDQRIKILGAHAAEEIKDTNPFRIFKRHYDSVSHLDRLSQHLYVDAKTWLCDDILVKVDRSTMAYGLEARSPFLDNDLVAYAATIPSRYKIRGNCGKYILKKAMETSLPRQTVYKKKSGFNAPIGSWLNNKSKENEFLFFARHVAKVKNILPADR